MSFVPGTIKSLKMRVHINREMMTLFDARDRGLVEIHRDPYWGWYSYQVISTGEVVSFNQHLRPGDQSEWYRAAIAKRDQMRNDREGSTNSLGD